MNLLFDDLIILLETMCRSVFKRAITASPVLLSIVTEQGKC